MVRHYIVESDTSALFCNTLKKNLILKFQFQNVTISLFKIFKLFDFPFFNQSIELSSILKV